MSTDRASAAGATRRAERQRRGRRRFAIGFTVVLVCLALVVVAGSALSLVLGPRLTGVEADPESATATSGSRVILTANQALEEVTADQVEVTPSARSRSTRPGAASESASPLRSTTTPSTGSRCPVCGASAEALPPTLETDFRTPPATVFLLERRRGTTTIYRTSLDGADREDGLLLAGDRRLPRSGRHDRRLGPQYDGSAALLRVTSPATDPLRKSSPCPVTARSGTCSSQSAVGASATRTPICRQRGRGAGAGGAAVHRRRCARRGMSPVRSPSRARCPASTRGSSCPTRPPSC